MKQKEIDKAIVRCWKNGWYVDNIARIVGCTADYAKEVLERKGYTDIQ
jgi:hypothetical protein